MSVPFQLQFAYLSQLIPTVTCIGQLAQNLQLLFHPEFNERVRYMTPIKQRGMQHGWRASGRRGVICVVGVLMGTIIDRRVAKTSWQTVKNVSVGSDVASTTAGNGNTEIEYKFHQFFKEGETETEFGALVVRWRCA